MVTFHSKTKKNYKYFTNTYSFNYCNKKNKQLKIHIK